MGYSYYCSLLGKLESNVVQSHKRYLIYTSGFSDQLLQQCLHFSDNWISLHVVFFC